MNAWKAVSGVTFLGTVLLVVIESWVDVLLRRDFLLGRWTTGIGYFALFFANYFTLVHRGHGIRYEREFSGFKTSKKMLLLLSWAVMLLIVIGFCVYSRSVYLASSKHFHLLLETPRGTT